MLTLFLFTFAGIWHGTCVAVKSILLPANMSGQVSLVSMLLT